MKWFKAILVIIALMAVVYFVGPHPEKPVFDYTIHDIADGTNLDSLVNANESKHHIKPNNEAKIIWADSNHQQTDYAIVYLHGFSASQMEGDPVHRNIAKQMSKYGIPNHLLWLRHFQIILNFHIPQLQTLTK